MKTHVFFLIAVFVAGCLFFGCTLANVQVEMLSERTALENQVLGAYNALDTQMLLAASVRGVDSTGQISRPPAHSREYKDAVAAMQTLDFHADDLERFKQLGWAGENNQGLVTAFGIDRENVPESLQDFASRYTREEFNFVIEKINKARQAIMMRVIHMNEDLDESELGAVQSVFAKINAENARPGEKIQDENGDWQVKKEAS